MAAVTVMLWDILICAIPHRHGELAALLAHLDHQVQPGVRALCYYDNLEHAYGDKCQALVNASQASYVSFLDDDDWVADDFIKTITDALQHHPDYVGFKVLWTKDGQVMLPVEHSLHYDGWYDQPNVLLRDINQFNPIRRSLARLGRWEGGNGADRRWAEGVRASGRCRSEVWINRAVHHYRDSSTDTFLTPRKPFAPLAYEASWKHRPSYPWLDYL